MSKTRLIAIYNYGSIEVFGDLFDQVVSNKVPYSFGPGDTIVLEGGTDINPRFYRQHPIPQTQAPAIARDNAEKRMIDIGIENGCSFLGICRGAQFLCASAGGSLIQDVTNHSGGHFIEVNDNDNLISLYTSSVHHQMMYPFDIDPEAWELIAWCKNARSTRYLVENEHRAVDIAEVLPDDFVEPEIVWFSKIRGLAIQGHPEFMPTHAPFVQHCRKLVKEKILNAPLS